MAQVFNSRVADTAYEYAKALLVPITKKALKQTIEENPFYPSLYSISHVFEKNGIPNEAYRVEDALPEEIPAPFIAYARTNEAGKDFVLVTSADKEKVTFTYNKKHFSVTNDEFLKIWEKIAFIAKPTEKSGEADYIKTNKKKNISSEKHLFLLEGHSWLSSYIQCSLLV
jgi:ABC-type bacteriocin/lantibiotic exporter with double-glycine peptidase domain